MLSQLQKNKIKVIFIIDASKKIGLGHIFRSISISKLLQKYKVTFLMKKRALFYFDKLNTDKNNYMIYKNLEELILILKNINPNLIVNDRLNNSYKYMKKIKICQCKIINIEDFGKGNNLADYSIDELNYNSVKSKENNNKLLGYKYFIIREFFSKFKKISFNEKIKKILLIFGGTDPKNYIELVLNKIIKFCYIKNITIYIACGISNKNINKIEINVCKRYKSNVKFIKESNQIPFIMSQCDFAFTSNGRTVLELAYMNIPSIILFQNIRESKHDFYKISNGSIVLGFCKKNNNNILENFKKINSNSNRRKQLYDNLLKFNFSRNKFYYQKFLNKILHEK